MTPEEIENKLVEMLCQRNGWDFPSGNADCGDYDTAVGDVKWFINSYAQLAHKSRPDREKIARFISEFKDWDGARQYIKEGWLHKADQILALFPDEEEIRKDERNQVIALIDEWWEAIHNRDSTEFLDFLRQVLKEK